MLRPPLHSEPSQHTCSFTSVRCFAFFSYKKCHLCLWPPPRSQHVRPMGTVPAHLSPHPSSSQGLSPAEPTPPSHLACACAPVTTPAPLQLLWLKWAPPPPGSPPGCLSSTGPPFTVHTVSLGWRAGVPSSQPRVWPQHGLSTEQTLCK